MPLQAAGMENENLVLVGHSYAGFSKCAIDSEIVSVTFLLFRYEGVHP